MSSRPEIRLQAFFYVTAAGVISASVLAENFVGVIDDPAHFTERSAVTAVSSGMHLSLYEGGYNGPIVAIAAYNHRSFQLSEVGT